MYCELDEDDFQLSPIFDGTALRGGLEANQNIYLYYLWPNNHSSVALLCVSVRLCVCACKKVECDAEPKSKVKYSRLPLNIAVANRIRRPLPTG